MSHLDPQFLDKLSEDHKRELDALVAFFRRNVQALKQEITRAIRDESDTLTVSLYTVEEITAKLASLQDSINAQVHSEFEHYLNQVGIDHFQPEEHNGRRHRARRRRGAPTVMALSEILRDQIWDTTLNYLVTLLGIAHSQ